MRTRSAAKLSEEPSGTENEMKGVVDSGNLANKSREAVGRLLKKANSRKAVGTKRQIGDVTEENCEQKENREHFNKENREHVNPTNKEELEEPVWEDGCVSISDFRVNDHHNPPEKEVIVEFSNSSAKRKPIRRASAEDKELAELVHKVHLLCLLGRGRLVDSACNDPLVQASLLSLLPPHLKIGDVEKLTADKLVPIVEWFRNNFQVQNQSITGRPFKLGLASAIDTHEGTAEEVTALSVALFRALNLTTRFVSILDVASLKPDADMPGYSNRSADGAVTEGFPMSPGAMVANLGQVFAKLPSDASPHKTHSYQDNGHGIAERGSPIKENDVTCTTHRPKDSLASDGSNSNSGDEILLPLSGKACNENSTTCSKFAGGPKRKSDAEFELQLEMALSATAAGAQNSNLDLDAKNLPSSSSNATSPFKLTKKIKCEESPGYAQGSSSAVWSRKVGPPLYWEEVFCNGEALTGRWVHVDAANAIIDGEYKVEAAVAACRRALRYVVAFCGSGAKDVTRRYCMKWYTIASHRINSQWWNAVLAPLKELESGATAAIDGALSRIEGASRSSLEDMELETRALTEPLPTNQLAYKNHQLYAIERWLTKYQVLHPRGPILGYCSGHPVFPRTCVQVLQTKQRWFREGLQVKANESPAKVVKRSQKLNKVQSFEGDLLEDECDGTTALYGRWQMEPLHLPHAVDGIVPKNEWGRVDAWSKKCLPPGTVHLRFPRLVPVAKRLGIDFAPAMVGFEFRNGRSFPVYEGIVVCTEFKDAIMEAYAEEEERREAEEKKRIEAQAISRWRQLISSMITRQRLKDSYEGTSSRTHHLLSPKEGGLCGTHEAIAKSETVAGGSHQGCLQDSRFGLSSALAGSHEHVFLVENQSFDDETSLMTKRCLCGFSIQVEEM